MSIANIRVRSNIAAAYANTRERGPV
jgi:hypothetical protein